MMCEKKIILWNPAAGSCNNGKYLASIIDDSATASDEIIETTKTNPTKTVLTKSSSTNFYVLLAFLLIINALLIPMYCYLIKHKAKQKDLLSYYITNDKLKEVLS